MKRNKFTNSAKNSNAVAKPIACKIWHNIHLYMHTNHTTHAAKFCCKLGVAWQRCVCVVEAVTLKWFRWLLKLNFPCNCKQKSILQSIAVNSWSRDKLLNVSCLQCGVMWWGGVLRLLPRLLSIIGREFIYLWAVIEDYIAGVGKWN